MASTGIRRTGASHFYAIVSTALVLFLVGISLLIFLHGNKLISQFKESIEFTAILHDQSDDANGHKLAADLKELPWVVEAEYVSKADAAERYIAITGDDFRDVLENNPLYSSVNIRLDSDYANADSLKMVEALILAKPMVSEFYYEKQLVGVLDRNVKRIGWIVGGISLILLAITIFVIDSTMRLSMYSNRFTIRSMQLVGATRWFIVKPFLSRSMVDGLLSAILAVGALGLLLNVAIQFMPELYLLQDVQLTLALFILVSTVGIVFTLLSTYKAVTKYLRVKLEDLY